MTRREGTFALARRRVSAAIIVAVGALVLPALWTGEIPLVPWQVGMLAIAGVAIATSLLADRSPAIYSVVAGGAVLQLVTVGHDQAATPPLPWAAIVGDLVLAIGIATLLVYSVVRRLGPPCSRDLVEAAVVAVGASVATWAALVAPLIDRGEPPVRAVMGALYVPISVIVAAFAVDLWNNGLRSNRAVQLGVLAAVFHAGGALVGRVMVGYGPDAMPAVTPTVLHSLAGALLLAALVHPRFPFHLERVDSSPDRKARLAMVGTAVLVAVIVIAVTAPAGQDDTVVRAVGTMVLVALVVVRLAVAIHENELAHESLRRRIYRDELTDLPTRTRFVELVHETLESSRRSERRPSSIHVNVDRFKNINDTFGHREANQVLVEIADRIRGVAELVGAKAARLEGDDFAIIDPTTHSVDDALAHAERIRAAFAEPVEFGESSVFVTASIGVAVASDKRTLGAEELIRRADIANHHAKLDGGNRVAVFDDSMRARVAHRMDVEHALHGAIARDEMRLHHQPIIDITTGRVCGVEALIRWRRADGTLVSPAAFIPIAEDTGMICEIGAWALRDALGALRTWIDTGVVEPTTTVSVNVSPRQIADRRFADDVRAALDETGVPAHLLWLEMTESMMLDEPDLAGSMLREVRSMGVRLALDDFGTGFSSLSLLQKFPIQRIKIDRAFVQGIADNTNDRSLVRTIVAMANSMGLDLVAEGVETVHQLRGLRELGCARAQGYLISHPVPPGAMRSTMSALAELTSLSLFDGDDRPAARSSDGLMPGGRLEHDVSPLQMASHP